MLGRWTYWAPITAIFAALMWVHSAAYAAVPVARGSQVQDFHRLTFEWPRPTYLTAGVNGQVLTIRFERKADPDMKQMLSSLQGVLTSHSLSADGQTLTLQLNGHYRARSFVSGSVSGVDLIASSATQPPAKVIHTASATKQQRVRPEQIKRPKANIPAKPNKPLANNRLAGLSPAAGESNAASAQTKKPDIVTKPPLTLQEKIAAKRALEAKRKEAQSQAKTAAAGAPGPVVKKVAPKPDAAPNAVRQVVDQTPPATPKPASAAADKKPPAPPAPASPEVATTKPPDKPVKIAETTPEEVDQATQAAPEASGQEDVAAAATPPVKPAEVVAPTAPSEPAPQPDKPAVPTVADKPKPEPTPTPVVQEEEPNNVARTLQVRSRLVGEELQLIFPWQKRTAAAAYIRNNVAWVVFNNVAKLDLKKTNILLRSGVTIKQIPTNEATVFYIPISPGAGMEINNIEGTFRWQIKISSGEQSTAEFVPPQLHTDPPLKPHVLLPFLDVAKVVRIKDPIIGDELDVLPVFSAGKGVSPARSFTEFQLLDSVQGLVVLRKSNDTTVDVVRNGVRVSTHQGATITPGLPLPEEVNKEKYANNDSVLLPFDRWKVKEGLNYVDEIDLVKKQIARSLVGREVDFFLRLAQLHLAYGEAVEALGYLQNIKRIDPELYIKHRLSALQGAANFLLHRYKDAARNFRVRELKDLEETKFWQVMLDELLGKPTAQFDYDANYEPFIQYYPPILKQRIGIFAADRYIASKDYNAALKVFDQLNEHKLINEVADYINYLMGKIALETQKAEDGYDLWLKIIYGPATEFVKVRAEFALIIETMNRRTITREQAIDKLEGLAMRWRGDNLELAVLSALSELYEEDKNWPEAMRVWRAMDEAFPNTEQAVEASRKMDEAFIAIFDLHETGGLTDLELMFLYTEYRDLVPEDDVGDRIVENLANLMVRLDMLDQAADMLDSRMRYRFEHVDRSKVGAKLAEVYLLDAKPDKALEALQLSVFGVLPEHLLNKRTYLSAEALLMLGRYSDLFLLLKQDTSAEADYYRMQAHWKAKDWRTLADSGELVLKSRSNPTAPLSKMERDTLVKLALAYVALGEHEQSTYLREYFTPLMKGKPKAEVFTYLTQPYLKLTPNNFDEVIRILDNTQMFLATDYGTKPMPDPDAEEKKDG